MDETGIESLPKSFALKSVYKKKFLTYTSDDGRMHGFVQSNGHQVVSPFTKFSVEDAKSGGGLVHIRCSYNNKYWVRWSYSSHYIVAGANESEEDRSKFSCTLFEPIYDSHAGAFRFRHVQLGYFIHIHWQAYEPYDNCLFARTPEAEPDKSDLFTLVDWDSIFVLPKYVAFKGDNDKYLQASGIFLQFSSDDIGDRRVANEVFMTPEDGLIRLKNLHTGKFWVHDPNWIHSKSSGHSNDSNELFTPFKLSENRIALKNMGNNWFCKRLSIDNKKDCLNAAIDYVTNEATLEIAEPVLSRDIYNVNYRLMDARIYNEKPLVMAAGIIENNNTVADKLSIKLSYEDTTTTTWTSSISAKFGVKVTFETGVPLISEAEIEVSLEVSEEHSWGETVQTKNTVEVIHETIVPPATKVKTSIIATQGHCDVPFSYTQRDKLMNGETLVQDLEDGLYTGVNCYNYQFLTETL